MVLYPQQIKAAKEISVNFINNNRSGLLIADVQSGKTSTFIFVIILCFLKGIINHVIIMC